MSGTKRKSPAALTELCHDALAEGVLVKHDGLPESWLAMFKAHPAAWAQLQKAALAPDKRNLLDGRELTEESTVFISLCDRLWDGEDGFYQKELVQFVAPATGLPKWLFILLQTRLRIIKSNSVDGTGGHVFKFTHPEDVAAVWKELCIWLPVNDALPYAQSPDGRAVDKAMCDIFYALDDSLQFGLYRDLEKELSMDMVEICDNFESVVKSNRDKVADLITEALRTDYLLDFNWANALDHRHRDANRAANFFRAPALSLHFDYAHWSDVRSR